MGHKNQQKKMKIVATIEARMAATRLPDKVLMKIAGKPMLRHIVERIKKSKLVDEVVIATTTNPKDKAIEKFAKQINTKVFRGSEEDVLLRVLETAKANNADIIVEFCGDCPLIDPEIIDQVIKFYLDNNYDYVSNFIDKNNEIIRGLQVQVFSTKILEEVSRKTNDPADRENVSLYIYEHPEKYKLGHAPVKKEFSRPELRWTVDTIEDLILIRKIYEELYTKNKNFTTKDVLYLLEKKQELLNINKNIKQKPVR